MSILPGLIYLGLLGGAIMTTETKIKKINVKDAVNNINNNIYDKILDVRTVNEFNNGHLENVLFYESLGSSPNLIDKVVKDIPDKDSKILIYCRSGKRASKAAEILINNGYIDVSVVFRGGYTELNKSI